MQIFSYKSVEILWPKPVSTTIYPVFLPYLGCPVRCVFCAQDIQTGVKRGLSAREVTDILANIGEELENKRHKGHKPPELAFYGGTFTALPEEIWQICLKYIVSMQKSGLISTFRCSTRPDCLELKRLHQLKDTNCHLIELGIQSFNDNALTAARRGYTRKDCYAACATINKNGFKLGVQLMPGMPGCPEKTFLNDVAIALSHNASILRFYPCLALANTELAEMWRNGMFQPWSIEQTLLTLARGWNMARKKGVPVIRMGLAQQTTLKSAILAGPAHASLGSRVQAYALLLTAKHAVKKLSSHEFTIYVPKHVQGYFWGWKGELKLSWLEAGLNKVIFWERDVARIESR